MIKRLFTIISFLLLCGFAAFAQNTLTIPSVTIAKGKSISLPVRMNNTADIVAVQFTITVPDGITLDAAKATLAERAKGHSLTMRQTGVNQYMAVLFSGKNAPISGSAGKLLSVDLTASSAVEEGAELPLTISDVVMSGRDGTNLVNNYSAGNITISVSPDFAVSSLEIEATEALPGENVILRWQVSNVGGLETEAGWSESVYLNSMNGAQKLLTTIYSNEILAAGAMVSRSAEITLPELLGIDGNATFSVKLTANNNSGEQPGAEGNNLITTESTIAIGKKLTLSPTRVEASEKSTDKIRYLLKRSGSTAAEENFAIMASNDNRITLPASVTISKGLSGAYFYAQINPNGTLDNKDDVNFEIQGNSYSAVTGQIVLEDDTKPMLTLATNVSEITEGEDIVFTIGIERPLSNDLTVELGTVDNKHFNIPASITIPTGKTETTVTVQSIDDSTPNIERIATFTVYAAEHQPATADIIITDNDIPTLQIELSSNEVSESAGPLSVTARIKRISNIDKTVKISLTDNSDNNIYYARKSFEMAPGVEEVKLNLGPIDNALVDDERTYFINAAVYIETCNCNASEGTSEGVTSAQLTVFDNDGPTLSATSSASVLKEGGNISITISRNTSTEEALIVSVTSEAANKLNMPSEVVIPAGKTSTTFNIESVGNNETGDGYTATVTLSAANFSKANVWFSVSDQTLPDAQITDITLSSSSITVGDAVNVNTTVSNTGSLALSAETKIYFYLSNSSVPVATAYLTKDLEVGNTINVSGRITLPENIGTYSIFAVVNEDNKVAELAYNNNHSSIVNIKTTSPFTIATSVNKNIVKQDEPVCISGKITCDNPANRDVEVYIINSGYRHKIDVKTDINGNFQTDYLPYKGQLGHFAVGACYPGENAIAEMVAFDIYGLKRTANSSITNEALVGETYSGSFEITNPGVLDLTGVKATIRSKTDNCNVSIECPKTIEGNEDVLIKYTVQANSQSLTDDWDKIIIDITTNEGANIEVILYHYCRVHKAQLKASIARINTTMTKGYTRNYTFNLTNTGKNETGKITIGLPSWIKTATPKEMASLKNGETGTVILQLCPTDDMQLNVPKTGTIAINCENGDGISLPYNIEPVSESTGTLIVDVCDEFTYNTTEAPHLNGAEVKVQHPTTGEIIAQGTTDKNGLFTHVLPEGYYTITVTAEKHDSYRNNILLDPGVEKKYVVNLSYQAITVDWQVEKTEIEDEYRIVTNVTYETSVPVPVVLFDVPEYIEGDNMAIGETKVVNFSVKNVGLVTALNTRVTIPENSDEWKFEALDDVGPFDLGAQQGRVIPVAITRLDANAKRTTSRNPGLADDLTFKNCMAAAEMEYWHMCGDSLKNNKYAKNLALKMCGWAFLGGVINDALSELLSGLNIFSPVEIGPDKPGTGDKNDEKEEEKDINVVVGETFSLCNPCDAKKASDLIDFVLGKVPIISDINNGMNKAIEYAEKMKEAKEKGTRKRMTIEKFNEFCEWIRKRNEEIIRKKIEDNVPGGKYLLDIYDIVQIATDDCEELKQNTQARNRKSSDRSWLEEFNKAGDNLSEYILALDASLVELFGDRIWLEGDMESKIDFFNYLLHNENYTLEDAIAVKPADVSNEQVEAIISRINNFVEDTESLNKIDLNKLDNAVNTAREIDEKAIEEGYDNICTKFNDAFNVCMEKFSSMSSSSSVCASIKLEFSQKMVMTRQAFRGTLTVFNGNETDAMQDIRLNLIVKDENNNLATSREFQINMESLKGFNGNLNFTDGWTLDAQQTGVATVLFIPSKYAAPTNSVKYSFAGSLSYIDPYTGLEVTRNLSPVTLTVDPSPNLDLTYFMQRDVWGDDPLTEEVEPSVPSEFALLINNTGYGDATNVRLTTEQPKIVDNEKGLLITFELLSSQLNGEEKTLALGGNVTTEFGTIPAKTTSYAKWMLSSSLLGHFTEYEIEATHVSSYGNPDLSLLDNVTIHELIRSIDVVSDNGTIQGFVTNDIVDINDTPDMIYLSDGNIESVAKIGNSVIEMISPRTYRLTLTPSKSGWNYDNINDPTYGVTILESVVRESDGSSISLRNFWQTDRTLRDGMDPLYEHRIHFIDEFANNNAESYILTFKEVPEQVLAVKQFIGTPAEDALYENQLTELTVEFNKPFDASTFTYEDITIACQGKQLDNSKIVITKVTDTQYKLDLSNVTVENGYYTVTVQTAEISDNDGYCGNAGKHTAWLQWLGGKIPLNVNASPAKGGTVSPESGLIDYNQNITLSAEAAEGYKFNGWQLNGEKFSMDKEISFTLSESVNFTALFVEKQYNVKVNCDAQCGSIENGAPGIYDYGTELLFTAVAAADYEFTGWTINGEEITEDATLNLTIKEDLEITANFIRVVYHHKLRLYKGWNWVSSYIQSSSNVNTLGSNIKRIIGKDGESTSNNNSELVGDVTSFDYGSAYKVETISSSIVTLSGNIHNIIEHPIELQDGWNWISYPHYENRDFYSTLINAENGDIITSHEGFAEFTNGEWIGTIDNLKVGNGYLYKSVSSKKLVYDLETSPIVATQEESLEIDIRKYPHTMNIIAELAGNINSSAIEDYNVYAMVDDEIRGIGKYINNRFFITVYGEEETEVTFIVENEISGERYLIPESMTFISDVIGSYQAPHTLYIDIYTSIELPIDKKANISVYNVHGILLYPDATIKDINMLPAGLYIINGQKFIVK